MPRSSPSQSLKAGARNGRAWIATRTFDGIETDLNTHLDNLDAKEVRFLIAELGALLPAMEEKEREENEKRRAELVQRKRQLEGQIREVERDLSRLGGPSAGKDAPTPERVCPQCGQADCDPEGVGHYRG